jgi:hypothetical protein
MVIRARHMLSIVLVTGQLPKQTWLRNERNDDAVALGDPEERDRWAVVFGACGVLYFELHGRELFVKR